MIINIKKDAPHAIIYDYSQLPKEKEVMIPFGAIFIIKNIKYMYGYAGIKDQMPVHISRVVITVDYVGLEEQSTNISKFITSYREKYNLKSSIVQSPKQFPFHTIFVVIKDSVKILTKWLNNLDALTNLFDNKEVSEIIVTYIEVLNKLKTHFVNLEMNDKIFQVFSDLELEELTKLMTQFEKNVKNIESNYKDRFVPSRTLLVFDTTLKKITQKFGYTYSVDISKIFSVESRRIKQIYDTIVKNIIIFGSILPTIREVNIINMAKFNSYCEKMLLTIQSIFQRKLTKDNISRMSDILNVTSNIESSLANKIPPHFELILKLHNLLNIDGEMPNLYDILNSQYSKLQDKLHIKQESVIEKIEKPIDPLYMTRAVLHSKNMLDYWLTENATFINLFNRDDLDELQLGYNNTLVELKKYLEKDWYLGGLTELGKQLTNNIAALRSDCEKKYISYDNLIAFNRTLNKFVEELKLDATNTSITKLFDGQHANVIAGYTNVIKIMEQLLVTKISKDLDTIKSAEYYAIVIQAINSFTQKNISENISYDAMLTTNTIFAIAQKIAKMVNKEIPFDFELIRTFHDAINLDTKLPNIVGGAVYRLNFTNLYI